MKRWALCAPATLVFAAVIPALPAAGATPTTIELVSGAAPIGSPDPDTDASIDGGKTYQDALVVAPHFAYSTLPGSGWVAATGGGGAFTTTLFRRAFELPAGATGVDAEVCVHTDNAARITLNGTPVGEQPDEEIFPNFQDPAECYTAPGTLLRPGENVLQFAVHNFSGPTGLNYRATVTYQERVNTPPVLQLPADITVNATSPQGAAVTFTPTVDDDTGAQVSCDREPGSTFAIGVTTVSCTATDDDGATAGGSFTVTVRGAREQLSDLLAAVAGAGPGRSLEAKIRTILDGLPDRALPAACEPLRAFAAEVQAQSGRSIPATTAAQWIADATRIRAVLGCR